MLVALLAGSPALHAEPVRYRGRLLYDGTQFCGSQYQPLGRSVAATLQGALSTRMAQRVRLHFASRTDAGVHARGQAFHFDLQPGAGPPLPSGDELVRACNAMLPPDLRVRSVEEAPERATFHGVERAWHSMYWAHSKLYSYRLCSGALLEPLERRERHLAGPDALDVGAMAAAAAHLVGEVDCAAFANRRRGEPLPREYEPAFTRRTVHSIRLVDEGGGRLRLDFHLRSAHYRMVRNMVGLLAAVGGGGCAPDAVPGLVATRDRLLLPPPAPAHGLTLESVYYDDGWGGAHRAPAAAGVAIVAG